MSKLPSFQFYPGDWMKDAELRLCSIFARGLLVDLLCIMFEAKYRGKLVLSDGVTPWSDEQIADAVSGGDREDKLKALSELVSTGVLKRDKTYGYVYSSRLLRDEEIRLLRAESGSKGGSKTQANRQANAQAKSSSSTSSSTSSSISSNNKDKAANAETLIPEISEQVPYEYVRSEFDSTFGRSSRMTDSRRKALAARWRDQWWRDNWQAALQRAASSAFLKGANDRSWVIDLEFFLRPDSVTKILEGKYDNRQQQQRLPISSAAAREQRNADAFAILEAAAAAQIAASGSGGLENNLNRHQAALCYEEHDGPDAVCSGDMGGGAELF